MTADGHARVLVLSDAAGPHLPSGLRLLHSSDDPAEVGRGPLGDSLVGGAVLSLAGLAHMLASHTPRAKPHAVLLRHAGLLTGAPAGARQR